MSPTVSLPRSALASPHPVAPGWERMAATRGMYLAPPFQMHRVEPGACGPPTFPSPGAVIDWLGGERPAGPSRVPSMEFIIGRGRDSHVHSDTASGLVSVRMQRMPVFRYKRRMKKMQERWEERQKALALIPSESQLPALGLVRYRCTLITKPRFS